MSSPPSIPCVANVFSEQCPSRDVLRLVGDRWTLLVVALLEGGTRRNSELLRQIGGISPKVLSSTLRKLEQFGFVERRVHPEIPPRVEYSLTPLGRSLSEVVVALDRWVETNYTDVARARAEFEGRRGAKNPWQEPEVASTLERASARRRREAAASAS